MHEMDALTEIFAVLKLTELMNLMRIPSLSTRRKIFGE